MEYYDLGTYGWPVTTRSPEAQLWFNRGMAWCYGFHHEEAIACFERALQHDAQCAMAHWGIAYAVGPNYNKRWEAFDAEDKRNSLARALDACAQAARLATGTTAIEQGLIAALAKRYPPSAAEENFAPWNDAYADAMRDVHAAHHDDVDVCALFADALMNRTPWQLWDLVTGEPTPNAGTREITKVLEAAFRTLDAKGANRHPGLLHLYVHLMEMSPHPERALKAGDTLVHLVPDAGHLVHMSTHIDVLCGHYHDVVARNSAAIVADSKYMERAGAMNFYSVYRSHNYHFKVYGAMFLAQYAPAMETAEELIRNLPPALLQTGSPPMADWLEGMVPIKQHVLIRFGKWREILDQPLPDDPELYCVTTALMRYARAVAMASLGDVGGAEAERDAFLAARGRVPKTRMLFNNTCLDILAIADAMMIGEIEYRKGNHDLAFEHLRRAVELDDNLPYDEPWGWMQPARHALAALLMEQGRLDQAEAIYRADLGLDGTLRRACQHPDNVWSLHGLHECLARRGETVEAAHIKRRLDIAVARADVPIKASCYCRLRTAA
ncbi:MAG: tetratricopeptide repeat protein [Hypericibacter sp.]